eukprot:gene12062-12152_t
MEARWALAGFLKIANTCQEQNVLIYKIVPQELWEEAVEEGLFTGAEIDHEDGYIHFSTAEQAHETAAKHFAGEEDLLLVALEADSFGALKWEVSRGGALFPHLYGIPCR